MVAYSFKRQFVEPIQAGRKRQTIRAERKRHAHAGEELQLYSGMRTRNCLLIGRATCLGVREIRLELEAGAIAIDGVAAKLERDQLDVFAQADGFADWAEMRAFWRDNHPGTDPFTGVLIEWGALRGQGEGPFQ